MASEVRNHVGLTIWQVVPRITNALVVGMSVEDIHTLIMKENTDLSEAGFKTAFQAAKILANDACEECAKRQA